MCAVDCLLRSCTCTFWLFGHVLRDHDVLIVAQQLGLLPFVSGNYFLKCREIDNRCITVSWEKLSCILDLSLTIVWKCLICTANKFWLVYLVFWGHRLLSVLTLILLAAAVPPECDTSACMFHLTVYHTVRTSKPAFSLWEKKGWNGAYSLLRFVHIGTISWLTLCVCSSACHVLYGTKCEL